MNGISFTLLQKDWEVIWRKGAYAFTWTKEKDTSITLRFALAVESRGTFRLLRESW